MNKNTYWGRLKMFFTAKEQLRFETYDELKEIVLALLHTECPEHRNQHHILYSANLLLAQLEDAKKHFQSLIDPTTPIGQYAREVYESARAKHSELNCIVRGYMLFCDEGERNRLNHNLYFSKEKIKSCYMLLKTRHEYKNILPIEPTFWLAIKEQILPILADLE